MLFATLLTPWDSRKWLEYSDTEDYIHQSKIPISSPEFWAPHHSEAFYPRPFTVPLLYKLAGSEPVKIVLLQKFIHCLSVWFLVFSLLLCINSAIFRYLLMMCLYLLMSWWNIAGWTNQILSESLSLSLLFCWIASFILAWKRNSWYYWLLHLLVVVLFSFTRDSWPYLLIFFYVVICIVTWFWERPLMIPSLLLVLASFILFFVQQETAVTGQRYRLPLINTIAVRIIGNGKYTAWFRDQGMPCTDSLEKKYKNIDVSLDADRHKIWDLYYNKNYEPLWNWILDKGPSEYMKFMLTHPSYTLLLKESKQQRQRIFAYDLWYSGEVAGYSKFVQPLFPLFNPWWLSFCTLLLIIQFFRKKKLILIFPVILSLVFLLNVFLSYNADALEVERHLFLTGIMVQMIMFISLALIGDSLIKASHYTQTQNI